MQGLIDKIVAHEDVDIDWFKNYPLNTPIIEFALRFLHSNLNDPEIGEALYDSITDYYDSKESA